MATDPPPQPLLFPETAHEDAPQTKGVWPDWYRPTRGRITANMRVWKGRHPFGRLLGPPSSRCRDCIHVTGGDGRGRYFKCAQSHRTRGAATDLVKRWRGCEIFETSNAYPLPNGTRVGDALYLVRVLDLDPERAARGETDRDVAGWIQLATDDPRCWPALLDLLLERHPTAADAIWMVRRIIQLLGRKP